MRILVIGCGSIGSRRARLLAGMGVEPHCTDLRDTRAEALWSRLTAEGRACAWVRFDHRHSTSRKPHDAALICTPADTHLEWALECLQSGINAVFIENPLARTMGGVGRLQQDAHGRIVMVSCTLRFALKIPHYAWTLLDLMSSTPGTKLDVGDEAQRLTTGIPLDLAYREIDLAYSVNGPIERILCYPRGEKAQLLIEHVNFAHSAVELDWSSVASHRHCAVITAYDDGSGIRIPHEPQRHAVVDAPDDEMYANELLHFLACVQTHSRPCCTLDDAADVLSWALKVTRGRLP